MGKYRRSKVNIDLEMDIAIGCITSQKFTRDFRLLIGTDLELLKSKYLRIIITWALDYFEKYGIAPNESIMGIYKANREHIQNEEEVDMIESALETINEKYIEDKQKFDSDFIYAQVELYIKGRALEENCDKVKGLVSQGKIAEAEVEQKSFKRKEKSSSHGINVFKNMDALNDLFIQDDSLFKIPGALGELVPEIVQGDFIMIGGNSKRGKSFYTMQLAMYAVQAGLKVMYISLEMNEKLLGKRIAQFVSGKTFKNIKSKKYIPYFDKNGNICYEKCTVKQLTPRTSERAYRLFDKQCHPGEFHIFDTGSAGSSIDSFKNTLINESNNGTDFDVVIIDQLSLISGAKGKEKRHMYDDSATRIKRELCEEMGLIVLAPMQFSKVALKSGGASDTISEAYSTYHHSTLLLSLNQTEEMKERGIMEISGEGRNEGYEGRFIALQNFTIGRPILDTRWKKDIPNYNDVITTGGYTEEELEDLEDI